MTTALLQQALDVLESRAAMGEQRGAAIKALRVAIAHHPELSAGAACSPIDGDSVTSLPCVTSVPESDKLLEIIAAAYQIAGAYEAPDYVLDVLANPTTATQEQIDALLPFAPMLPAGTMRDETWGRR